MSQNWHQFGPLFDNLDAQFRDLSPYEFQRAFQTDRYWNTVRLLHRIPQATSYSRVTNGNAFTLHGIPARCGGIE
jgi:hypothetical protein